jgi:hypothetical protein
MASLIVSLMTLMMTIGIIIAIIIHKRKTVKVINDLNPDKVKDDDRSVKRRMMSEISIR